MNQTPLNPHPRRKKKAATVNLVISMVFHAVLITAIVFLAAKEGMLGKKMQKLTATLVPKEKQEPPKQKPPEPKVEQAKEDKPKTAVPPPVAVNNAPPPANDLVPAAAPAATALPAFEFNDGAKDVQTITSPTELYKALVESALRSRWNRPDIEGDELFTADVELTVDAKGNVEGTRWVRGSGNARWDDSVKAALAETRAISRPPPRDFPLAFTVRFDVDVTQPEPVMHLGSR